MRLLKIGELAQRTGLTVRTLRHYDQIGLLSPRLHSEGGHRLYGEKELRRLQKIQSLKALQFSLSQIGQCLEDPDYSLRRVIELHLERARAQLRSLERLLASLKSLEGRLEEDEEVSGEQLLKLLEDMQMYEKYYSPEQMKQLQKRADTVGPERIQQVQDEWKTLFQEFESAAAEKRDPAHSEVQKLAQRAVGLIAEFTGGDPGIEKSLGHMYKSEGLTPVNRQDGFDISSEAWNYMQEAMAIARKGG